MTRQSTPIRRTAADADFAGAELSNALLAHGPIHASCRSIELLENSSGRWESRQVFPLSNGGWRFLARTSPPAAA